MGKLRLFLALLVVDWILGIPGVGVETRTGSNPVMDMVYTVAFLALIAALVLTWRGQRFASPVGMLVGAAAAILAVGDLFGISGGGPAPAAMVVVDVAGVAIGLAIVWAASQARTVARAAA